MPGLVTNPGIFISVFTFISVFYLLVNLSFNYRQKFAVKSLFYRFQPLSGDRLETADSLKLSRLATKTVANIFI